MSLPRLPSPACTEIADEPFLHAGSHQIAFRKKIYRTVDERQANLDAWVAECNQRRLHQGRWCFGKTPMQTFLDALPVAKEKPMAA
jgi:hypothetical protein